MRCRPLKTAVLALGLLSIVGCRAPEGPRSFVFPSSEYEAVLDATRDELRRSGYTLERVDAVRGEILTTPKTNAGFVTPFNPEYNSLGAAWEHTLNNQPRTVRVRFRDAASVERGDAVPPIEGEPIHAEVDALIWRMRRPGWRLETETIRESSYARDPLLAQRGVRPGMLVPLRRDDTFAVEFAQEIQVRAEERLADSASRPGD